MPDFWASAKDLTAGLKAFGMVWRARPCYSQQGQERASKASFLSDEAVFAL